MDLEMLHLSLVISISGLLILAFAGGYLEPPLSSIGQVNTNFLGRNVHLRGNLSDFHEFEGGSILLVLRDSTGEIDVYLPYNVAKMKSDLLNSTELEVVGSVEVYRGRLEVVVEDVGGIQTIK
jgi:DNA/RNA endonuclease YhcR with UshA esterase domain